MQYSYDLYDCVRASEEVVDYLFDKVAKNSSLDDDQVLWGVVELCTSLMLDGAFTRQELLDLVGNVAPYSETILVKD